MKKKRARVFVADFGEIKLEFHLPSGRHRGWRDICREIGEKMGTPFQLTEPESVEDFEKWVLKIGYAFIGCHPANDRRRTGRPRDSVAIRPTKNKEAQKQRDKRARRRLREDEGVINITTLLSDP
jgi:hypothetical protein